ncbi:hypothetical protein jhhlp_001903 [Lomentospora prolificans]|uniref:Myb-like domain-containing protein n=1 Tax=Lomentospora prolificans TaxID=41688 RepID=A0A2N3NCL0_9PEZI|nr:hypothetical protein jhhlp_001903 [Lomentospora prolificans]
MSSMFKKKTGPSIKPKLVPRGRPTPSAASASASATASPAPPSTASTTASPAPQPPKPADVSKPPAKTQQNSEPLPTPPASRPTVSEPSGQHPSATPPNAAPESAGASKSPERAEKDATTAHDRDRPVRGRASPTEITSTSDDATVQKAQDQAQAQLPQPGSIDGPAASRVDQRHIPGVSPEPRHQQQQISLQVDISRSPNGASPASSAVPAFSSQSPQIPIATASPNDPILSSEVPTTPVSAAKSGPAKRGRKRKALPSASADQQDPAQSDPNNRDASQAPRRPRQRRTQTQTATADGTEVGNTQSKPKRQRKKPQADGTAEVAADGAQGRSSRARSETPPDAENRVVDLQKLKMSDLTRDLRIGKKFSRHDELRDRERQDRSRSSGEALMKASQSPAPLSGAADPTQSAPAPSRATGLQFQIVNGQIMVDQSSLVMDRHARDAVDGPIEEVEENEFTHKVTSNSFRTGSKLRGPNHWSDDDTEKFYHALKRFGTDFEMIAQLFPGRQRRHIKMKFNREEKFSRARIDAALVGPKRLKMDFDDFKAATGKEYEATADIHAQLKQLEEAQEAAQRQQEEEDAEINRQRLEALHGPDGVSRDGEATAASS